MTDRTDSRLNPTDPGITAYLRNVFLFLFLGGAIGGLAVGLFRAMESETDFFNALKIAGPCVVVLLFAFLLFHFLSPKSKARSPFRGKIGTLFVGVIGVGLATWTLAPTQQKLTREALAKNKDYFEERAAKFFAIKQALADLPPASAILPGGFLGEVDQLADWSGDLRTSTGTRVYGIDFDTVLLEPGDFARLEIDRDPDEVKKPSDHADLRLLGIGSRQGSFYHSAIDELAQAAFGDPGYYSPDQPEDLLEFMKNVRQVVVVRMEEPSLPLLDEGGKFYPGFLAGQAHVFELETADLLGSFSFAATNSDSLQYSYRENAEATAKASSAMAALSADLERNGGKALLHRIHQIAPGVNTGYPEGSLEMPYGDDALAAALLGALREQRIAEENFAQAIEGLQEASQNQPPAVDASAITLDEESRELILSILQTEGKISAIKELRALTGASLKDSKDYVESLLSTSEFE
ncbi:MAG: hypothetical protein AAF236_08000 [Verrucomicrobiota bacterium]